MGTTWFVCDKWHSQWAYECLDSWQIRGEFLLGTWLFIMASIINLRSPIHPPIGPLHQTFTATSSGNFQEVFRIVSTGRVLFPLAGVHASESMIISFSLRLGKLYSSTTKKIAADYLIKLVLHHKIALIIYLGGVCAIAKTTCCTWINSSGKVET